MSGTDRPDWFLGDLDDPWVAAIAAALPGRVEAFSIEGEWPEVPPEGPSAPRALVVHRALPTPEDAARMARYRAGRTPPPRLILCVGPHARQVDLEWWANFVDAIVPEATARETIARHVHGGDLPPRPMGPRPRINLISPNFELRQTLADACEAAGYPVATASDWPDAAPSGVSIWDVPLLEPDWEATLARRARLGRVALLLGFPDRELVTRAHALGASGCLELPCELADLVALLDRLTVARGEPAHEVPPPPAALRPQRREARHR